MATETEKTGRCGWVALLLVLFLLPGLLPGSFLGGFAGLKAADALIGHLGSDDLVRRIVALLGMIFGLLTAAATVMFATMAVQRIIRCKRTPAACPDAQAGLPEKR